MTPVPPKEPYPKKCSCGKTILMVEIEGKVVPVDTSAAVYAPGDVWRGEHPDRWVRVKGGGVNHFKTCPDADQYNRGKKADDGN